MLYDICVVGAGMIGSSMARHISDKKLKVCLVGPEETENKKSNEQIRGAYFDEGRLCRQMYTHPSWAIIARRAADRYDELMMKSGINFFHEVGCLTVMSSNSQYKNLQLKVAQQVGVPVNKLTKHKLDTMYSYLNVAEGDEVWLESNKAGYVNPRQLVKAQQHLAKRNGCNIIHKVVDSVHKVTAENGNVLMKVITEDSEEILANKVILATGAFTEFKDLLPVGVIPDITLLENTVVLAEVGEEDLKEMRNMPSMMYNGSGHYVDHDNYLYTYLLPPIQYPDGKIYLKIGHMNIEGTFNCPQTLQEVVAHYKSDGNAKAIEKLTKIMAKLFPDFTPISLLSDSCVTAHTSTGMPYIDMIHPNLGVAIGGNGSAGKSCDEIGRMAAELITTSSWTNDLPKEWFEFKQKQRSNKNKISYAKL